MIDEAENKAIQNPESTKGRKATIKSDQVDEPLKPFGRGACPECHRSAEMAHEPNTGKVVFLHEDGLPCPPSR